MVGEGRSRSILGLVLMAGQAFFFNAVFFTFGLMAKQYFHVDDSKLPLQLLPFAIGSFMGPIPLEPLFDKVGRKTMFGGDLLGLTALKICFSVIFFVASSAANAAYLTVSEIFPLEIRLQSA